MPLIPYLVCGRLTRNGSPCPQHERERLRPKRRRQKAQRQAAERAGERIDREQVWARDGGLCGICGRPADPERWELDHVVSLEAGGAHVYSNVRVSHPRCNAGRGGRRARPGRLDASDSSGPLRMDAPPPARRTDGERTPLVVYNAHLVPP